MDKIDRQIVTLLEQDARQSFADLGQQVGLSKTPCWHRVRDLEPPASAAGTPRIGISPRLSMDMPP